MERTFRFYCAGVDEGKIRFAEDKIMHAKVERRQRTQMQETILATSHHYHMPFTKIFETISSYEQAVWSGGKVILQNGQVYEKHISYEDDSLGKISQVWALRNETAL